MPHSKILVGAHVSIAGKISLAVDRAMSIGATTMQIFTKSNRSWFDKPLSSEDIEDFRLAVKTAGLEKCMVHSSYLINVGAKEVSTENNSIKSLALELGRAESLGMPYLVLHPGSHTGAGVDSCVEKITSNLNRVLAKATGDTMILVETMAGQGTNVGSSFEELQAILEPVERKDLIGVCFDTCHAYSAGYDLGSEGGYDAVFKQFDEVIGLTHLKAFHVNDSKTPLGSHKDRHEELGKGTIPITFFEKLMKDKRFQAVPKILETPPDPAMDLWRREISLLKSFCG